MRNPRILFPLTFFFLLFSCASWRVIARPEWRLQGIQIEHLDRAKAAVGISARIKNPNSFGVTVQQVHYRLYLKETLIAEGEKKESFDLPRNGAVNVVLPVEISLTEVRQMLPLLKKSGRKDDPHWRLEGECTLEAFGIEKIFPFKKEGGGRKTEEPADDLPADTSEPDPEQ